MDLTTKNILLIIAPLFTHSALSMYYDPLGNDPANSINYTRAFDQSELQQNYIDLMQKLGCADNVLSPDQQPTCTRRQSCHLDAQSIDANEQQLLQEYQQACLEQLQAERTWALMQPAREGLSFVALLCGALALLRTAKNDPTSQGYGISMALVNSVYHLPQSIKSLYYMAYPPAHPLHTLEEQFAIDRCFIPRVLWPTIEQTFILARQNQYEQRQSMDAIAFALGLTIYKPKPPLPDTAPSLNGAIDTLTRTIEAFFDAYAYECDGSCVQNNTLCTTSCTWQRDLIALNVAKFVQALYNPEQAAMPRYIYLKGPGGIGKSYFVEQLYGWIEELLPGCVTFENSIVSSPEQLEGSAHHPGILLRVLRRQLVANTRGSLVFLDEANWLNDPAMIAAAKRTFNGNQSRIATRYFGDSIGGAGIELPLPPMLIVVAGNHAINDPALKSRFDVMQYPLPTVQALTNYAQDILQCSNVIVGDGAPPSAQNTAQWITRMAIRDFRTVASQVEQWARSSLF